MFPRPTPHPTRPCARCGHRTRVDRLIHGFGEDCAAKLGLTAAMVRLRVGAQTGPTLFDNADEDDSCDGWDR